MALKDLWEQRQGPLEMDQWAWPGSGLEVLATDSLPMWVMCVQEVLAAMERLCGYEYKCVCVQEVLTTMERFGLSRVMAFSTSSFTPSDTSHRAVTSSFLSSVRELP